MFPEINKGLQWVDMKAVEHRKKINKCGRTGKEPWNNLVFFKKPRHQKVGEQIKGHEQKPVVSAVGLAEKRSFGVLRKESGNRAHKPKRKDSDIGKAQPQQIARVYAFILFFL